MFFTPLKVFHEKRDYSKVESKCGSKDYIRHKAQGGDKKVLCLADHFLNLLLR